MYWLFVFIVGKNIWRGFVFPPREEIVVPFRASASLCPFVYEKKKKSQVKTMARRLKECHKKQKKGHQRVSVDGDANGQDAITSRLEGG